MKKDDPCPGKEVCDQKYMWKDRLYNMALPILLTIGLGSGATIFGMGVWKAQVDINLEILTQRVEQTELEMMELKRSIEGKLDTLIARTK